MPRPKKHRCIAFNPHVTYFKPRGIPLSSLQQVTITEDELEALRLKNIEENDQTEAARQMHISQSTFQRILSSAYIKIADALVHGKAFKIEKQTESPGT
jgi:predicted DNA-binding protein (UPF0251 family)